MPIDDKSSWEYKRERGGGSNLVLQVATATKEVDHTTYKFGTGTAIAKYTDKAVFIQPNEYPDYQIYQEPMSVGATWTYDPFGDGKETVEAKVEASEDICTGAGFVKGAYRVRHHSEKLGDSTIWVAPGVGMVKTQGAIGQALLVSMKGLKAGTTACKPE
jgi:hypothetical protein